MDRAQPHPLRRLHRGFHRGFHGGFHGRSERRLHRARAGGALLLSGALLPAVLLASGCGAGAGALAPRGLAYDLPDPNPATYTFTDSTRFSIETPGAGELGVSTSWEGVAELDFHASPAGHRVVVRFPRFRGTFENAAQGADTADAGGIGGPFVVELGPRGDVVVVDTPSLDPLILDITGPAALVRPFFAHLPGRQVERGATWTDTVVTRQESAGRVTRATTVLTSTLLGDTAVDGRTLLRIRTRSAYDLEMTGVSGGVAVEQRMRGVLRGRVLWDPARSLLYERVEEGELSGALSMPETGATPMPVRAVMRRRISLGP